MRKIRSVEILTNSGITVYTVGNQVNGLTIAEIKNMSLEYEDSRHGIYDCRDADGKLVATIDNCPVIVEYMEVSKK
jgi:hypothetical protein